MEVYCVYEHIFPNGKRYIGLAKQPVEKRWKSDGSGYISNKEMYDAIKKYGWKKIKHNILADGLTRSEAQKKEKELINRFDTIKAGYNKRPGGTACGCLYSKHVMKIIRDLKRFHYYHKDFLPTAERMLELSCDEGWAYQVNLVDYVMRTEVDGYKHGIAYVMGDSSYEVFDWYYYISKWIEEPEVHIKDVPPPCGNDTFTELVGKMNEGSFDYE